MAKADELRELILVDDLLQVGEDLTATGVERFPLEIGLKGEVVGLWTADEQSSGRITTSADSHEPVYRLCRGEASAT